MGDCGTCAPADFPINWAVIVSLLSEARLDIAADRTTGCVTWRVTWRVSGVDNQPAAVVPAVIMIVPPVIGPLVPIAVAVARGPAAIVMVGLIAPNRECLRLLFACLASI